MVELSGPVGPAPVEPLAAEAALSRLLALARADLAAEIRTDAPPEHMIGRILTLACRLIPGAESAGVCLLDAARVTSVATTGEVADACEAAQAGAGEGPDFDVAAGERALHCADLAAEDRWPRFVPLALATGARGLLTCELPITRNLRGSLTLYAVQPGAFDEVAELVLPVFAARVSIALAYSDKLRNLRRAIDTRQLIGQACGILMERHRLTADQAFGELVAASQQHHVKLRELATRVVESGQDPAQAALE